jgi:hypothetical protein
MATTNILSRFKQTLISNLIESVDSPVTEIVINAGGSGYSNGDILVFDGDGDDAAGVVFTSNSGAITHIALTSRGNYMNAPNVEVSNTSSGTGASLTAVIDVDRYYMFAGRALPYDDEAMPDPNYENDYDAFYFQHEQMQFGKRVSNTDISFAVRKVTWESNTVYAQYDDKEVTMPAQDFFVLTSDNHVFKCIYNAEGAPSTVEPSSLATEGMPATLADGYKWKYLYTITGSMDTRFTTTNYIPVLENANVVAGAIDGGIFNVIVEEGGSDYPNITGTVVSVSGTQIVINGASTVQDYYANSTITVFGASNAVTNRKILESYGSGNNVVLIVANTFNANQISAGYEYTVGPTFVAEGDGQDVEAYFIMNSSTGTIVSTEIIDPGSGYNQLFVNAESGTAFGSNASLRAVISPKGGHGSDVYSELFCKHIAFTGEFTESTIQAPDDILIRVVGMMKNPEYANGEPYTLNTFNQMSQHQVANTSASNFSEGETVVGNSSRARGQILSSNSSVMLITGYTGEDGGNQFQSGEVINGQTSGVQFIYGSMDSSPDFLVYTGEILYLQNITAAERSPTSSEQIKLIMRL